MNRQVDRMDDTEALVALYLRSRMILEPCGTVSILPMHWVPGREELKHEEFMCAVGLNHRYPKDFTRPEDTMASHITKAQLLRAQLQAKIASGALKAPPPAGDPKKAPRRAQAPVGKAPSVVHVEESDHEDDDHMLEDGAAPIQADGAESAFLDGFHMAWAELSIRAAAMARRKYHIRKIEVELDGLRRQKEELSNKVSHLEAEIQRMESNLEVAKEKLAEWKSTHDGMKAKYMKYEGLYAKKKEKLAEEEALMFDMLREEQKRLAKEDEVGAATESVTAEGGGPGAEPSSQGPSTLASRDGSKKVRGDRDALYHVLMPGALPPGSSSSSK
ncbi:hypothetical protein SOVF_004320 [Spinacia oleracea]|nr:hypothetical protein SOVF_004320 [Spinacia oleracea]